MVEKIFFQSSMPRAMSTLLQNLLSQNSDFYVTPTSGLLELWFGARANYTNSPEFKAQDSETMKKAFSGFCREATFGYFNAITDKKYVIDKSRGHGIYRPFIETFYPNPKIICMVRDLKDVVCSFEKIYRKNPQIHSSLRDDLSGRGVTIHRRVDEYMHDNHPCGKAVNRIFEMTRLGYDDKILFVKAENLCLHPKTEMIRIYEYLEIPYFEHDFENIEQTTIEDDEVYGIGQGLHTIRPKLEMKPSDAKAVLGADICDWLYNTYKWYYDKFGYKK
jgi:sulfotransferase